MASPLTAHRSPLTFHVIPHTHWDREWYLTRAVFQARLIPVLDAALDQLERDPAARFVLDGQTILLEDYLAVRPEQEPRIAALVRRGALEIGPWYVLSDLLIPCGSSLRRNLAEGARDAARFGRRLAVLYSPDAFGHPACLPELAREFGMRWGVVRRGLGRPSGNDRDLYRWESSGASLLVHHLPAGGYDLAIGLAAAGETLARCWAPLRSELVARAVGDQIAVFLGADHHPMPRDVSGLCARLQALEPGHEVRVSGLTEYFEAVERSQPDPPVLRGELRRGDGHSWVLQGVHSARSRMKHAHGDAELGLSRIAEPLARSDQEALLRLAWRTLLQSQFHDTLAGTSSDAVQQEQAVRLAAVAALAREIATAGLGELAGYDPDRAHALPEGPGRLLLWNPSQHARAGIVAAELSFFRKDVLVGAPSSRSARLGAGAYPFALAAPGGELIPVQVLGTRREQERLDAPSHYPDQDEVDRVWVAFQMPQLAARELRALAPASARRAPAAAGLVVSDGFLQNRLVSLRVSATGSLTLTDRSTAEEYRSLGELVDEPDQGDLYTFSRGPGRDAQGGRPLATRILARGPLVGALEVRWHPASAGYGELAARLVVTLYADSSLVRLRLELDNRAANHRLRTRFPIGAGGAATAGAPLGVERQEPVAPRHRAHELEQEVATAPAQRFVAAGGGARTLAVLAPGFFEYEWSAAGQLYVTLLRSIGELSRGELRERPGHAAWPTPTPLAQEPGTHRIELAVAPLSAELLGSPDRVERLWEEAFLPVQACYFRNFGAARP
jgi:2-O-(6-phospho-alpha-D-mannosyl)-D-glycerate hydrolase